MSDSDTAKKKGSVFLHEYFMAAVFLFQALRDLFYAETGWAAEEAGLVNIRQLFQSRLYGSDQLLRRTYGQGKSAGCKDHHAGSLRRAGDVFRRAGADRRGQPVWRRIRTVLWQEHEHKEIVRAFLQRREQGWALEQKSGILRFAVSRISPFRVWSTLDDHMKNNPGIRDTKWTQFIFFLWTYWIKYSICSTELNCL